MSESFVDFLFSFLIYYLITGAVGMVTIGEYTLHRLLFHPNGLCSYLAKHEDACHNDAVRRMLTNPVHHHVFMQDTDRVVPHYTIYLCLFSAAMAILLCVGIPLKAVALIGGGLFTGSLVSDSLHYSFHFGPGLDYQWYRNMKATHHAHHYSNSNCDFGITTDLVDRCLGTKSTQTDSTEALRRLQQGELLWNVQPMKPAAVRRRLREAPKKP
jgi:sterol desaturase/sphingolipid hydroxylase (fatty acid hydroxylase superfamily)